MTLDLKQSKRLEEPRSVAQKLLDGARAHRAGSPEAKPDEPLNVIVPRAGRYAIDFDPITSKKDIQTVAQGLGGTRAELAVLVKHVREVHLRDPATGELHPFASLTDDPTRPVRVDQRLKGLLDLSGSKPTEWLTSLYTEKVRDKLVFYEYAVSDAARQLHLYSTAGNLESMTAEEAEDVLDPLEGPTSD